MQRVLFIAAIIAGIVIELPVVAVGAYVCATELLRASVSLFGDADPHAAVDVTTSTTLPTSGPQCHDAIAWRDFVPPEQQAGTRFFTRQFLDGKHYGHVTYITATRYDGGSSAFTNALVDSAHRACDVDIFLLELGRDYTSWLRAAPARPRVRLVYDTGGNGAIYADAWRDAGVERFVGHNGPNLAPIFYVSFLPRYVSGAKLEDAVRDANDDMRAVVDFIASFLELAGNDVARLESDTDAHIFAGWPAGRR